MTLDQVSHTHPPCGVAHPLASRISSPRSFLPRLSFPPSLSEDPDLPEFSRRHQKRHGHLDVQSQISHALADESEDTSISQINFFLSLVNAKRVLFSPLVIVGSQIFERPSGGRYGGRWISERYLKSNIYQIFGVQKSVKHETGSNPRPRTTSGKLCRRRIPFDHRSII